MLNYISDSIKESLTLKEDLLNDSCALKTIESVADQIFATLKNGGKVLLCGNGGSASDSQHIAAEFVGRFTTSRRALAAIALTTDTSILTAVGNDYGFEYIFSRQVEALACEGDILIALSTSGNSKNVEKAIEAAKKMGVATFGLFGGDGGACKTLIDSSVVVKSSSSARVQELHILIGHILCGIIDLKLLKDE